MLCFQNGLHFNFKDYRNAQAYKFKYGAFLCNSFGKDDCTCADVFDEAICLKLLLYPDKNNL